MINEVKTYHLSCDGCDKKMVIEDISYPPRSKPLPEGWKTVDIWGKPAGHNKDFCPSCSDKASALQAENDELRDQYWSNHK